MKYLSVLSFLLVLVNIHAQLPLPEFGIKRYGNTIEEPFHSVLTMEQDPYGRLVAYRSKYKHRPVIFDGYNFTLVDSEYEGIQIRVDSAGTWMIEESFTLALHKAGKSHKLAVRDYLTRNISGLRKHNSLYYLFTNDGIIRLNAQADALQVVSHHNYGLERIENIHITKDTVYLHTGKSLHYALMSNLDTLYDYTVQGLDQGSHFVLPSKRFALSDVGEYADKLIALDKTVIRYLVDSKNRLWTYQRGEGRLGVYLYRSPDDEAHKMRLGLEDGSYVSFFEDNLGDMWLGTQGEGLLQLYEKSVYTIDKDYGSSSDNVWSIYQKEETGDVYLSLGCSGLEVVKDSLIEEVMSGCYGPVLEDSKGRLWVATLGMMLKEKGKPVRKLSKADGLYSRTIYAVFEDSNQDIWVTTRRAIHKYVDGRFEAFVITDTDTYDKLFNVVEVDPGKLLIIVDNGSLYTFEGNVFTKLQEDIPDPTNMIKDADGQIWLASASEGLFAFLGGKMEKVEHSLIPSQISFIQDSDNGQLWGLSPETKLFYADRQDLLSGQSTIAVSTLTSDDGLPLINSNTLLQPSTCKLTNGDIIFPNIHGGILVQPEKYTKQKSEYTLIYGQVASDVIDPEEILLAEGVRQVELFAKAIYLNPERSIEVFYSVDDGDYQRVSNHNAFVVGNLSSGRHTIRLKSKHANQEWSEEKTFVVHAPHLFYEKWWFILGSLLLSIGLITLLVKWRTSVQRATNKRLQEKVDEQTQEIEKEKKQLANALQVQKELTQQLNISQETKNRMYAQISHEFRSPLQAINLHLDQSYSNTSDKENIRKNIKNLLGISNEILDLSKAEAGELRLKADYYNINSILLEQLDLMKPLAENKKIRFQHTIDRSVYLWIDMSLIQKVVSNLISNAIKFSFESSVISIHSESRANGHYVAVEDLGQGVPADEVGSLTEDYYQASNSEQRGTGIGLSLAERILNLHKSSLDIKSTLGQGSTFSFVLPIPKKNQQEILEEVTRDQSIEKQLSSFVNPSKPAILAIDDNTDVLQFLKRALTRSYNVIISTSAIAIADQLDTIRPALIISDINMPVMSGLDFLKLVRQEPKYVTLPFLFLSGSISEETEIISIKSGADFILQKPINHEYLLSQVEQMLKRQQSMRTAASTALAYELLPRDINTDDLLLMQEVEKVIIKEISNPHIKSADIAQALNMGEKTLRNRVKQITGLTVKGYLKNYRLERAIHLLEQGHATKSEVATAVGFSSLSYFSSSLKEYKSAR